MQQLLAAWTPRTGSTTPIHLRDPPLIEQANMGRFLIYYSTLSLTAGFGTLHLYALAMDLDVALVWTLLLALLQGHLCLILVEAYCQVAQYGKAMEAYRLGLL